MDSWFLLQTKSRQERRALENLERQGVNCFCPMVRVEKISRGLRLIRDEVLFPGYLFVNFNQTRLSFTTIRSTRGVRYFVTQGGSQVIVPYSLIEQLKQRTEKTDAVLVSEIPKPGDELKIIEGPFRGLNAVFTEVDGDQRAVVLINMLNQEVKASLPLKSLLGSEKG